MVLPSSASVVDWVRGTLLVPYRAALAPDDDILNQRLKGVARFAGAERFKVVADA